MTYQEWHEKQLKENPFFQFLTVERQHKLYNNDIPESEKKKMDFVDMLNNVLNKKN
jgi:hypothetical protein